jgi:hypothetical protein
LDKETHPCISGSRIRLKKRLTHYKHTEQKAHTHRNRVDLPLQQEHEMAVQHVWPVNPSIQGHSPTWNLDPENRLDSRLRRIRCTEWSVRNKKELQTWVRTECAAQRIFCILPGTQNSICCPLFTEYLIDISCGARGTLIRKRQKVKVL